MLHRNLSEYAHAYRMLFRIFISVSWSVFIYFFFYLSSYFHRHFLEFCLQCSLMTLLCAFVWNISFLPINFYTNFKTSFWSQWSYLVTVVLSSRMMKSVVVDGLYILYLCIFFIFTDELSENYFKTCSKKLQWYRISLVWFSFWRWFSLSLCIIKYIYKRFWMVFCDRLIKTLDENQPSEQAGFRSGVVNQESSTQKTANRENNKI